MDDQASEGILSPFLRRQRLSAAKNFLKGNVLNVGCGSGVLAEWVPPERYMGVDVHTIFLERAIKQFPLHSFPEKLPNDNNKG